MMKNKYLILIVLAFSIAGIWLFLRDMESVESISVSEATGMIARDSTILLLDVRTQAEYSGETGHLPGALLIPVQDLGDRIGELDLYKGRTVIAYCRSGRRSAQAARMLTARGHRVLNLEGGISSWNGAGLPVVRGK